MGSGLGDETQVAGRRCLPFGKAIDLVVMYQVGNIVIAAQGVEEMVPAFPVAIPIATHGDNHKFRVDYLSLVFHKLLYNERACQEWLWRRLSTPTV